MSLFELGIVGAEAKHYEFYLGHAAQMYSDLFKDREGFRPRFDYMADWTLADYETAIDELPPLDWEAIAIENAESDLRWKEYQDECWDAMLSEAHADDSAWEYARAYPYDAWDDSQPSRTRSSVTKSRMVRAHALGCASRKSKHRIIH